MSSVILFCACVFIAHVWCRGACVCTWRPEVNLRSSPLCVYRQGLSLAQSSRGPSVSTSWCWDRKWQIQHVTYFCLLGFELWSLSLCGRRFSNWAVSQDPTVYVSTFTVSIMTFSLASSKPKFSNSWLFLLIHVHIFCNLKIVLGLSLIFELTILLLSDRLLSPTGSDLV